MRAASRRRLLAGAWIALVCTVLMSTAAIYGKDYGRAMLPLYRWAFDHAQTPYRVANIEVAREGHATMIRVIATNTGTAFAGGHLRSPGTVSYGAETLLDDVQQHLVLTLLLPLAWPGLGWRRRTMALILAVPFLLAVELFDAPLTLIANLQHRANNDGWGETVFTSWTMIMASGGRFAVSLAAGLLAVGLSGILRFRRAALQHPFNASPSPEGYGLAPVGAGTESGTQSQ